MRRSALLEYPEYSLDSAVQSLSHTTYGSLRLTPTLYVHRKYFEQNATGYVQNIVNI